MFRACFFFAHVDFSKMSDGIISYGILNHRDCICPVVVNLKQFSYFVSMYLSNFGFDLETIGSYIIV